MDLILRRTEYEKDGIFSQLETTLGKELAVTLEHAFTDGHGGFYPAVLPGVYTCKRGLHSIKHNLLEPFETFEVLHVKGHTGILFHIGNFNDDSEGCILLGDDLRDSKKGQMVTNSKIVFAQFMLLQKGVDTFQLEVRG